MEGYQLLTGADRENHQAVVEEFFDLPEYDPRAGSESGANLARRLFAFEALDPGVHFPNPIPEPYSLQWFLDIEKKRHTLQGRWIPRLLEFNKHRGELLLGLGHDLGTDWAQYAQNGTDVVVCSGWQSQLDLVRRNFAVRHLPGRFLLAQPTQIPLDSGTIDVACLSSLHMNVENLPAVVEEIYRVLKPGGKILAVLPAHYDVDFWFSTLFFWHAWIDGRKKADPGRKTPGHSGRQLKELFQRFVHPRVRKRQLRRSEVPRVWRWLPSNFLARLMGRVLVMKAFKPLRELDET